MYKNLRGPCLVILALVLAFSAPLSADASPSSTGHSKAQAKRPTFTHAEAKDVLSEAKAVLSPDAGDAVDPAVREDSGDLTMKLRDLDLARPYLTGADRRTADRLLSRDTAAAKVPTSARPTSARPTALSVKCSTHFCVHYGTAKPAWVQTTLDTLEHVWSVEVGYMGGRAPLPDGGTSSDPNNPDDRLDVFLQNLAPQGLYGGCTDDDGSSSSQVSAYCVLDDNYNYSEYGAPPLESLRVTAAHEFFHAIQFAMDVTESLWFMEGSATWMEDHVYDSINDNYQYLATSPIRHPRTSLDYESDTFPYGSFIFFTYATERQDPAIVRKFWESAVGGPTSLRRGLHGGRRLAVAVVLRDVRRLEHPAGGQLQRTLGLPQRRVAAEEDAVDHVDVDGLPQREHPAPGPLQRAAATRARSSAPASTC